MTNKRMRLPREGVVEPDQQSADGEPDGGADVEGHGFPMPAPPADFAPRSPSQGGDLVPTDDDADGDRPR
jgi:hypothetical protein